MTKVSWDTILKIGGINAADITASDKTDITKAIAKSSDYTQPSQITILCLTDNAIR